MVPPYAVLSCGEIKTANGDVEDNGYEVTCNRLVTAKDDLFGQGGRRQSE